MTWRAEQLGLIFEALVVTLATDVAHLPAVLRRALTLAIPLPGAAPLTLPVPVANLPVARDHVTGPAVGAEVVLGAAHTQLVNTQPLPEVRPVNDSCDNMDEERVPYFGLKWNNVRFTFSKDKTFSVPPCLRLQCPPGLDVLLPVALVDVALHLAPPHVLTQLLRDLRQPDLAGGVPLPALLLPGCVPALQLAPLSPCQPRLEACDQVGAGPARGQLGGGLVLVFLWRIQTLNQEERAETNKELCDTEHGHVIAG